MSPPAGVAVFAKYPEPGKVKTRLAKSVGPEAAAAIYERLLGHFIEHTLVKLPASDFAVTWFCEPSAPLEKYAALFSFTGFAVESQVGADLGERLKHALEHLRKSQERVMVVGTDCIDLSPDIVQKAALSLETTDLTVGPTGDGGYYLLGLKQVSEALFDGIPWSTSQVLPLTLATADSLKWKTHLLPPLRDIDDAKDWEAIGWRCDEENEAIRNLRRKKT